MRKIELKHDLHDDFIFNIVVLPCADEECSVDNAISSLLPSVLIRINDIYGKFNKLKAGKLSGSEKENKISISGEFRADDGENIHIDLNTFQKGNHVYLVVLSIPSDLYAAKPELVKNINKSYSITK